MSQSHKVQKGNRVAGVSLHSIECPASSYTKYFHYLAQTRMTWSVTYLLDKLPVHSISVVASFSALTLLVRHERDNDTIFIVSKRRLKTFLYRHLVLITWCTSGLIAGGAMQLLLLLTVRTHPGKSWKVMVFNKGIFQAWKVMEKSWKNSTNRSWNFLTEG